MAALSAIETLALRAPAALGAKVTVIWQAVFAASELPQFWFKLKSSLLSPVTEIPEISKGWSATNPRVTGADDVPTAWLENARLEVINHTATAPTDPSSLTF